MRDTIPAPPVEGGRDDSGTTLALHLDLLRRGAYIVDVLSTWVEIDGRTTYGDIAAWQKEVQDELAKWEIKNR